ncbi:MAG: hypothetical protein EXS35_03335 [Pedosphaera sp.]|nr:hypothetical protein [Pedosphaera sp.]
MNYLAETSIESVERALRSESAKLERRSAVRWSLPMSSGARHPLIVQLDGEWLWFAAGHELATSPSMFGNLWAAVRKNAGLPAEIKLALTTGRTLELRADLLLTEELDVESRVCALVKTFQTVGRTGSGAFSRIVGDEVTSRSGEALLTSCPTTETAHTSQNDLRPAPAPAGERATELENLCEESGWRCVRRSSGRLTVALEVTLALQATVTSVGGGVRVVAELADLSSFSSLSRTAAAALALEITNLTPFVRASADSDS